MVVAYMDRRRLPLQPREQSKFRQDREYTIVCEFENEPINVTAEWSGVVKNDMNIRKQHWKPFTLSVVSIVTTDGERRPLERPLRTADPVASREFRSEQELIDAYEEI